ncbi:hypothetical protein [Microbacterium sp.]|uniref:hypothetical protein n=1 Tax=Microbacterium sp. TaxID=51671 RepID=UPI002D7FE600|nr:hypothetical protein [Microbacterium sp.]
MSNVNVFGMSRLSNTSPRGLNDALTSQMNGYANTTPSTTSAAMTSPRMNGLRRR